MTGMLELDAPRAVGDVADWLGIEVLPGGAGQGGMSVVRIRQLGKRTWSQRPGSVQELKLYRAVVGLVNTMPRRDRDVVLDVAMLRSAFDLPGEEKLDADEVLREIRRLRYCVQTRTEERDKARAAVERTNEDLIGAVERLRAVRAQGNYRANTMPFLRREGELNAFDMVLRLLRGEEIGQGGESG